MALTAQQHRELDHLEDTLFWAIIRKKYWEEQIADDRKKWEEGNTSRIERRLTDEQEMDWQIPCGKKRMNAIMTRIKCLENHLLKQDSLINIYKADLHNFIDSLPTVPPMASETSNGGDDHQNDGTMLCGIDEQNNSYISICGEENCPG
tara:strand:- start:144 stop:590 length:447 start_codon:yes stop_codon:yes gene_type:complete